MKTKHSISSKIIGLLIIHILIVLTTYFMVSYIQATIKDDAMFINKLGQVRGAIQRDAKVYLYSKMVDADGTHDAKMSQRFQDVMALSQGCYPEALHSIEDIQKEWEALEALMHGSSEISILRKNQLVFEKSEHIWKLTDKIVFKAQKESEAKQNKIKYVYYLLVFEFVFLIYIIFMIHKKVNKILENKSTELNTIFNISPDITIITSGESLIKANKQFYLFTGYESLEAFKEHYDCICEMFEKREGYLSTSVENKRWNQYVLDNPNKLHKAIIIKDEIEHIFSVTVTPFTIDNEDKYIVVIRDITELEKIASTDMLTQLDNRKKIEDFILFCIENFKRNQKVFSIIILDIDNFKEVNDNYGHDAGDIVLQEFATILKGNIRSIDKVGRWGGEEFMIVSTETDILGATVLAEKIRKSIEKHDFEVVNKRTASFGIAEFNSDLEFQKLYARADKALYKAKKNGRNRVEVFE